MLRRLFSRKRPLAGTPAIRRLKTYSAQTGYVYHYFFEGYRDLVSGDQNGREYVFSISADRRTWHEISVFLGDAAAAAFTASQGRELSSTERYAIAKMALFQAFDERETPAGMKDAVHIRAADIQAIVESLGL